MNEIKSTKNEYILVRIFIFAFVIGAIYWFSSDAERDETGTIVSEGTLDVFSLKANDCYNHKELVEMTDEESGEISSVEAIPCSMPHDGEIYALSNDLFFQTNGRAFVCHVSTVKMGNLGPPIFNIFYCFLHFYQHCQE